MKVDISIDGAVQRIPVPVRIWLGVKIIKIGEWLVATQYVTDVNLVPKFPAE